VLGSRRGTCELAGYCSFPDDDCTSGRRYGDLAGSLSAKCVVDEVDVARGSETGRAGTTMATDDSPDSGEASRGSGMSTGSTHGDPSESSDEDVGSTSTSGTLTGTSEATGMVPTTGEVACETFVDGFDRTNDLALGNGWLENLATAFQIDGGRVTVEQSPTASYEQSLVHRAFLEGGANIIVSVEFRVAELGSSGFPQVHARIQENATDPALLNSYILFVEEATTQDLVVARRDAGTFDLVNRNSSPIPGGVTVDLDHRLTLHVAGTNPVIADGTLERRTGSSWETVLEVQFVDSSADRVVDPGSVGLSGHDAGLQLSFDNFEARSEACDG